jgi:very-short-patch-repair endonuclease
MGRIVRVDFVYRALRIVIEADGFGWHDDPEAFARDSHRRNRLGLDGWLVLTFTWRQVMYRPTEVVEQVESALRARA